MDKVLSYILKFIVGKPLAYSDRLRAAALTVLATWLEERYCLGPEIVYGTFALGCVLILSLGHRDAPAGPTHPLNGK